MDQGALKNELADYLEIYAPVKRKEHAPLMIGIIQRKYDWYL